MKIKALSFRQPWAELVVQGKKTIDLRTWKTHYRGPLAVYASQTVEKKACQVYNFDPNQLTTGALIGVVDLVKISELDTAAYKSLANNHLNSRRYREGLFGWELVNSRQLKDPKPVRGRLNLFEVNLDPDEILDGIEGSVKHPLPEDQDDLEGTWGSDSQFELRIIPENDPSTAQASYRLALYQRAVKPSTPQRSLYLYDPNEMESLVELGGTRLRAIADHVIEALRENGYQATNLNSNRREPFILEEVWGVRLGLLFMAIKPLRKMDRVESISEGINGMTSEELYYWFSKCTQKVYGERSKKAFRILLADD